MKVPKDKLAVFDKPEKISALDPQGMLGVVAQIPELLLQAATLSQSTTINKIENISQVVVCGMGGSAISGDIVRDLLSATCPVPIIVNRNYQLPKFVNSETLVLALSYSGDTEETLAAVKMAVSRQANIIGVTSGGKLKALLDEGQRPYFMIPMGFQPRAALPLLLVPLLSALNQLDLSPIKLSDISAAANLLKQQSQDYLQAPLRSNAAKQLAGKLLDKLPIILGTVGITEGLARRFKTQLNENSKVTALANVFPELNHNEMVNLASLTRAKHAFALILLRSEQETERMKKRIEITKSLIGGQLGGITEIRGQGKNPLEQALSLILLADFVTFYLAILRGANPTEVDVIERLKKELGR